MIDAVDFDLPPGDDPRRQAVRRWLRENPQPTGRQLAEAGYVAPHWPPPWGVDADPLHQLVIDEELARAGVRRPSNPIAIGWAGPTLLLAGTEAQKQRYLWPALAGEEYWCQLFSEPDAGSDLASLTTTARADGDSWVVNGAKTWSSGAHLSRFGILIARTDPAAPRHRGISYFVCPMDSPGITVRPIVDMTGAHSFNHVFFDDVRLGPDTLVGRPGDGWRLAKATLANERVSLSSGGALWGAGPSAGDLVALARRRGAAVHPVMRQHLVRVWAQGEVLRLVRLRTLSARIAGRPPGPEASVQKLMADDHGRAVMELAKDMAGASGTLTGSGPAGQLSGPARGGPTVIAPDRPAQAGVEPVWDYGFCFSPALTIGGGTSAIQRNIVAEAVLGLPREPRGAPETAPGQAPGPVRP
ncbi:MAG TPA: acyl-CoA dehydrogenase family protein [Acidimicrobiales bacterium]|nr:acyl-CoA dehydrogenase family protein [Acidimicrobiales bacterium]